MALTPIKLFKGDSVEQLVESFTGFTDLVIPPPVAPEQSSYFGAGLLIPDNGAAALTWDPVNTGPELFDLTDPTNPLWLEGGLYAVTFLLIADAMLGRFLVFGALDATTGQQPTWVFSVGAATLAAPLGVVKVVTGGAFPLTVQNKDGTAARNFGLTAYITKLT